MLGTELWSSQEQQVLLTPKSVQPLIIVIDICFWNCSSSERSAHCKVLQTLDNKWLREKPGVFLYTLNTPRTHARMHAHTFTSRICVFQMFSMIIEIIIIPLTCDCIGYFKPNGNYTFFQRRARIGDCHAVVLALSDRKLQKSGCVYVSIWPPAESISRLCSHAALGVSDG